MKITNFKVGCLAPYILTTGLIVLSNKFIGNGYPFILDNENYDYIEETYTPISSREEIKEGKLPKNDELYLYTEWRRNYKTNKYEREVNKYLLTDKDKERMLDLLDFGNLDTKDVLDEPDETYIETKKKMDEFELLANSEGYKYIYNNPDNEKVIYEDKTKNTVVTIMELGEIILANAYLYSIYKERKVKKL